MQSPRPLLPGQFGTAHRTVVDGVAAAALAAVATVLAWQTAVPHGSSWVDVAVLAVATLGGVLRQSRTRTALVLTLVVAVLATGVGSFSAPWAGVAFVMYVVPQRFARREAGWLLAGAMASAVLGVAGVLGGSWARPGPNRVAMLTETALLLAVAWTMGYAVRQHRLYVAGVREREEQQAQTRHAEARRAMTEERLRIARELHDVVAHTMSVIAVQAGVANHVAAERPEEARRALLSIEETSRDAVREMRAMLGVLREGVVAPDRPAPPAGLSPQTGPGLDDLDDLVRRTADTGLVVDLRMDGARRELPTGLELVAYRIVQEAITNVIRHAATDRCRVTVSFRPDTLTVEVDDDGPGRTPTDPGGVTLSGGHGISGMRERVAMFAGTLTTGPAADRGFRVRATFPLGSGTAR
ncbi:sensor histidine kinase [Dactylosporangium sp. CA-152071]|uniref:sensor histidine kinase n=1 Tax=Dactylosporangium sp. CA-152071 TaxID=3239933 RepID=UPI003D8C0E94